MAPANKRESFINQLTAQNVVQEEEGRFGEYKFSPSYDEATKNIFIRNGRMDTAHGLLNTITILEKINRLRSLVWIVLAINALSLFFIVAIFLKFQKLL